MTLRPFASLLALLAIPLLSQAAPAAERVPPAAHRALYALTMESSRGGDVARASGTMAYEVTDACDGWATRQRLSMVLTNREGQDIETVSDYATWESKDGQSMRFRMKPDDRHGGDGAGGRRCHAGRDRAAAARSGIHGARGQGSWRCPSGTRVPDGAHRRDPDGGGGREEVPQPCRSSTGPATRARRTARFRHHQLDQGPWTIAPDRAVLAAHVQSGRVRIAFFDRKITDSGTATRRMAARITRWAMKYWGERGGGRTAHGLQRSSS